MSQIHQEVTLPGSPASFYAAIMEASRHAAFTGAPAEIDAREGGAFTCYGGGVQGRNIELVAGTRIVQAWRVKSWAEGVWSIARFEIAAEGGGTKLVFDQDGVPEDAVAHIDAGWHKQYWEKLAVYLA